MNSTVSTDTTEKELIALYYAVDLCGERWDQKLHDDYIKAMESVR